MTGIIINNNEYAVSTGSTKIEYNSMGGDTCGYSMYGDEIPTVPPIYKECEWVKTSDTFTYQKNFTTSTEYKIKFCATVRDGVYFFWCITPNTVGKQARYYMNYQSSLLWSDAGVQLQPKNNTNYTRAFNYESTKAVQNIPFNTTFTLGFKNGKFYSDIGGSYSVKTTTDNYSSHYPSLPFTDNVKAEFQGKENYKIYQLEEDSYIYKFFYNQKENKFCVMETTNNTLIKELDSSKVFDYQLK